MRTAYFCIMFCIALGAVMGFGVMLRAGPLSLDPVVQLGFGVVISFLLTQLWRQRIGEGDKRFVAISWLIGVVLCAFAIALMTGNYTPTPGRQKFVAIMFSSVGPWRLGLLVGIAGVALLCGTWSATKGRRRD